MGTQIFVSGSTLGDPVWFSFLSHIPFDPPINPILCPLKEETTQAQTSLVFDPG